VTQINKINKNSGVGINSTGSLNANDKDSIARSLTDTILLLILTERKISRIEIAKQLGISRSTASEIVKYLLTTDYIKEVGSGVSSGGRKPIMLEFQTKARVILGIDIGATHVTTTLIDLAGNIIETISKSHPVRTDHNGTINLVKKLGDHCLSKLPNGKNKLLSAGISLPSPIDPDHPDWVSEVIIPEWGGKIDLETLIVHFDVPIYVDNDANLGALAEYRWGAGVGAKDLLYIKISYGIGAGSILNGNIYRGANGIAGEMGHINVDPNGSMCSCGTKGCLATSIGGLGLEETTRELKDQYPNSILSNSDISYNEIIEAAIQDDELALKVINDGIIMLGRAIVSMINMMNPNKIILGGKMVSLGNKILDPIKERIDRSRIISKLSNTDVVIGQLSEITESIGAATLALETTISTPDFYRTEIK